MSSWWGFEPSRPIPTEEGIKAHSQKGAFVKHWWATRWIEALERLMDSGRLQRGRTYARKGQVLALEETRRGVEARVQGSRPNPYVVKIELAALGDKQWEAVLDALAERAAFVADLLAGEMPVEIESVFQAARVGLFPDKAGELDMRCSCPDLAAVCKHIAATHYILAERLDADPFLLFRLRGRDEAEIMAALRARQARAGDGDGDAPPELDPDAAPALADLVDGFWRAGRGLDGLATDIAPPLLPLPVLKRLGPPPFAGKDVDVARLLGPAYAAMTAKAVALGLAEPPAAATRLDEPPPAAIRP